MQIRDGTQNFQTRVGSAACEQTEQTKTQLSACPDTPCGHLVDDAPGEPEQRRVRFISTQPPKTEGDMKKRTENNEEEEEEGSFWMETLGSVLDGVSRVNNLWGQFWMESPVPVIRVQMN
ncbi:hypothetical protein Q7C36_017031 [Tachysurus vachellii]|uniref:Uncharacterized protein n=1 Tax=Tachysurus vachellii TaxID=175792 RepID=A0AA88M2C0_TACVA|nr:hypothetical protein Q7C36_017031 [Tachysurus vachellii]